MQNRQNLKLFSLLIISFYFTLLVKNASSPLFWLKLRLQAKNFFNRRVELSSSPIPSAGLAQLNNPTAMITDMSPLFTATNIPTQLLPSPTVLPVVSSTPILLSPTSLPNVGGLPNPTGIPTKKPTQTPPLSSPTVKSADLVWRSVFTGVSAAENPQTGELLVKVAKDTQYILRTYTLTDGRQITVIVPLFKNL